MLCNKELGSNRQLKIHLRSHTGILELWRLNDHNRPFLTKILNYIFINNRKATARLRFVRKNICTQSCSQIAYAGSFEKASLQMQPVC